MADTGHHNHPNLQYVAATIEHVDIFLFVYLISKSAAALASDYNGYPTSWLWTAALALLITSITLRKNGQPTRRTADTTPRRQEDSQKPRPRFSRRTALTTTVNAASVAFAALLVLHVDGHALTLKLLPAYFVAFCLASMTGTCLQKYITASLENHEPTNKSTTSQDTPKQPEEPSQ